MNYSNLTSISPKIVHPDGLECTLKPHQLSAIAAMSDLETKGYNDCTIKGQKCTIRTNYCFLSDKVGAGKTFTILGLLLHKPTLTNSEQYLTGSHGFSIKTTPTDFYPINLIVVPHNLVNQWVSFVQRTDLSYLKFNTENDFLPLVATTLEKAIKNKSVIILNINRYLIFKNYFKKGFWNRVIIDEVDTIRAPPAFNEEGCFNWAITSTPSFNRMSIFVRNRYLAMVEYLPYLMVKNSDAYVDQSMTVPTAQIFVIHTQLQKYISAFKDLIPEGAMELINSGNIDKAMSLLSCNVDSEENIAQILTKKIESQLHTLVAKKSFVRMLTMDEEAKKARLRKIKEEIASCKVKIDTIHEKLKTINEESCLICMESFTCPTILNCCKVIVCLNCLYACLKVSSKCPHCRADVNTPKDYQVIKTKKKNEPTVQIVDFNCMEKKEAFYHILTFIKCHEKTPRILVFSDYSCTFDKLTDVIQKVGLTSARIDGTPVRINKIVSSFDAGTTHTLLLDSKHYGSGLNLQSANYVILYHRMYEATEKQVIGRANRYGRNKGLKIIYLSNDTENGYAPIKNGLVLENVAQLTKMKK